MSSGTVVPSVSGADVQVALFRSHQQDGFHTEGCDSVILASGVEAVPKVRRRSLQER